MVDPLWRLGVEWGMADRSGKPVSCSWLDTDSLLLFFFQWPFMEHLDRGLFLPRFPVPDLAIRP